tara:strand:- start:274 stop:726 length:453 start_codon:yes stop_codon:yes gene_type:complete
MHWYASAGLGSLNWGLAYALAYYPNAILKVNPLAFNVITKLLGGVLMTAYYTSRSKSEKERIKLDLKDAWNQKLLLSALAAASIMWLSGEAFFYGALASSPTPATASAIYNLTPLVVLVLSILVFKNTINVYKSIGFFVILLSVYLMNEK